VVNGPESGHQGGEMVVGEGRDRGEGASREPGEVPGGRAGERLETGDAG